MGSKPADKAKKAAEASKAADKTTKKDKAAEGAHLASGEKKAKKAHAAPAKKAEAREEKRCQIKACKREYRAKGYCRVHYKKWRQGEYGVARYKTCKSSDCRKPMAMNRHGYCEEHFQNYYVKGMEVAHAPKAEKPAAAPAAEAQKAAG